MKLQKRNQLWIHAATLLNLNIIILEKELRQPSLPPKAHIVCIPIYIKYRKCKLIQKQIAAAW